MLNCSTVQQVPAHSPEKVHFYLEQVSIVQIETLLQFLLQDGLAGWSFKSDLSFFHTEKENNLQPFKAAGPFMKASGWWQLFSFSVRKKGRAN